MVAVRAEKRERELSSLTRSKMSQEKIQLLCLSTPTSVQHQSIIATVQFIMPSPFVNAEAFLDFFFAAALSF